MSNLKQGFFQILQKISSPFRKSGPTGSTLKTGPDGEALYDLSLLRELEDDQYLLNMLNMFLQNIPAQLENIRIAAVDKNFEKVYQLSHKLKGSAGMLQSRPLMDLLVQIERQGKERQVSMNDIHQAVLAYARMEGSLKMEKIVLERKMARSV